MSAPLRAVPDAAVHPLLTVVVRPDDDPSDRHAVRYMRTDGPNYPWVPVTGKAGLFTTLPVKSHEGVKGWAVQSFADLLAVLDGEARV